MSQPTMNEEVFDNWWTNNKDQVHDLARFFGKTDEEVLVLLLDDVLEDYHEQWRKGRLERPD